MYNNRRCNFKIRLTYWYFLLNILLSYLNWPEQICYNIFEYLMDIYILNTKIIDLYIKLRIIEFLRVILILINILFLIYEINKPYRWYVIWSL